MFTLKSVELILMFNINDKFFLLIIFEQSTHAAIDLYLKLMY